MSILIDTDINTQLEIDLIKEFGENCVLDGIINLEIYNKTEPKILWVLKEPNYGQEYKGNSDIDEAKLSDEEALKIYNQKKSIMINYYSDVADGYSRWRATFENISYITHGIIENKFKYDDITNIDRDAKIDNKYYIDMIAFINLKKAPGASIANRNLIVESYNHHKSFLFKQIETINPDIIINCSGLDNLIYEITADEEKLMETTTKSV